MIFVMLFKEITRLRLLKFSVEEVTIMKRYYIIFLVILLCAGCTEEDYKTKAENKYQDDTMIELNVPFATESGEVSQEGAAIVKSLEEISKPREVTSLSLRNFTLNDGSKLGDLENLEYLSISDSTINNFSFLSDLYNLKYLNISFCTSEYFSEIASLPNKEKLITLNLDFCRIDNSYNEETGYENRVSDIAFLEGFYNLESLSFMGNDISDINVLSNLRKLRRIMLVDGNWGIESLQPLYKIETLEHITLSSGCQPTEEDRKRFGDPYGEGETASILELD